MDPFRGRFLDMAEGQSLKESENYQECDGVGPMTRANSPDLKVSQSRSGCCSELAEVLDLMSGCTLSTCVRNIADCFFREKQHG